MHDESGMTRTNKARDAADALAKAQEYFEDAINGLTAVACDPITDPPTGIPDEGTYMYQIVNQSAQAKAARQQR